MVTVMVTDATLKLCLERGNTNLDVREGAEGITDEGILDFCFGESPKNSPCRYLAVRDPELSDNFVERLIQKCHQKSASTLELRIDQAHPFDLSACDETAKNKKKSKESDGGTRTTHEFDGFKIVICETVIHADDSVFIWNSLQLL